MNYYKIQRGTLSGIADAIRAKNGTSDAYNPTEMAAAIAEIQTGAALNIAYGDTAPEDASKLWVKTAEPAAVQVASRVVVGEENLEEFVWAMTKACSGRVATTVDGKVYLAVMGSNNDAIDVYDPQTKTFSTFDALFPDKTGIVAMVAVGKKLYFFGGYDYTSLTYLSSIRVFDTETNMMTTLDTTLQTTTSNLSAAAVGKKVYLFGGYSGSSYLSAIYVFNTETNTISKLSTTLPTAAANMSAAAVGTKIYLFGGYYFKNNPYTLSKINVFDTETNTISELSTRLPLTLNQIAARAVGTKIYLFGGVGSGKSSSYNGYEVGADTYTSAIYVFDTESNTISELSTTLPAAASAIAAATVGTDIYLFGGYDGSAVLSDIHRFATALPLTENELLIETSRTDNLVELIASDAVTAEAGIANVYLGNAEGLAEKVSAAVYKDGAWVEI